MPLENNYLAAPRPNLTLNDMLNKKIYAQNDATASQRSYKCESHFQTLFIVNYNINLSRMKT